MYLRGDSYVSGDLLVEGGLLVKKVFTAGGDKFPTVIDSKTNYITTWNDDDGGLKSAMLQLTFGNNPAITSDSSNITFKLNDPNFFEGSLIGEVITSSILHNISRISDVKTEVFEEKKANNKVTIKTILAEGSAPQVTYSIASKDLFVEGSPIHLVDDTSWSF